jgi:outer membrane protein assembly factor BamB
MASPSQPKKKSPIRLKKWILPITTLLAILLATSFLAYSYIPNHERVTSDETDKPFKLDIQHFANTIAVDDGKYFVLDDYANLTCLDAQNGKMLWQTNVGRWRSGGLLIKNGTIYAGTALSVVQAVDETTGTLLKQYAGLRNIGGWKGPANAYYVEDGRIFIEQNGCNAYNITTGEILWTDESVPKFEPSYIPYTNNIWAFEGAIVIGEGFYHIGDQLVNGIYRMDPDKGTIIWHIKGYIDQETLLYQDKVILSSYGQDINEPHNSIIAVNVASGIEIWSYDRGCSIYQPIIAGDRLLFVAQDGTFML